MKAFVLGILLAPCFASATLGEVVLVSKEITFVFYTNEANPFYMRTEHGGSCGSIAFRFSYFKPETGSPNEYLPILKGDQALESRCPDPEDLHDENEKAINALNARILHQEQGYFHRLIVKAHYQLTQIDYGNFIALREEVEFKLPELEDPFTMSVSNAVSK